MEAVTTATFGKSRHLRQKKNQKMTITTRTVVKRTTTIRMIKTLPASFPAESATGIDVERHR